MWAIVGLVIVVLFGGYLYSEDPFGWQPKPKMTSESTVQNAQPGDQEPVQAETAESTKDSSAESIAEIAEPSFDIVRVEPDGSTLIAGKADPGTTIEIVNGQQVLSKTQVGPSGDFAAIIENPLAPGDYEIILRAVGAGGKSAQSQEVATVSVPQENPSELLVMVTRPGEASRILTSPKGVANDAAATQVAAAPEPAETVAAATTAEPEAEKEKEQPQAALADNEIVANQSSGDETKPSTPSDKQSASAQNAPDESVKSDTQSSEMTKAEPATQTGDAAEVPATGTSIDKTEEPAKSDMAEAAANQTDAQKDTAAATAQPEPKSVADGSTDTTSEMNKTAEQKSTQQNETRIAKVEPSSDKQDATTPEAVVKPALRIDAVEIESGRIFVAGSATPGGTVDVFADGEKIGSSKVSPTGRFLVEAQKDIAVGEHSIGADLMMPGSAQTAMRVAVPFTRPEGEVVAAVAAEKKTTDNVDSQSKNKDEAQVDTEQTAVAPSVPAKSKHSTPVVTSTKTADNVETTIEPAGTVDAVKNETSAGEGEAKQPVVAASEPTEPVTAADDSAQKTEQKVASAQSSEPTTIVQPALEARDSSVIIRRGDTLWQISRRIYGRGVRYTTIYLANKDKITNPDFIEPGQIFMVPEEPLGNSEELHRQRIRR